MKHLVLVLTALAAACPGAMAADPVSKPLRVLLITGGCCHDYGSQKDLLKKGLESRAHVQVDQIHNNDRTTKARFDIYRNPDWAKGYDAVIHDECSPDVKDMTYVQSILRAHQKVPAVNLHCAMHSYRTGTDDWYKFVGIQSTGHGPQAPIAIRFTQSDHPVAKNLADWTTMKEELYNNVKVLDTARPLAWGRQAVKRPSGEEQVEQLVVAWTNRYGDTRVFSTSLGHNSQTVADDRYLDLVTRGLLWASGRLDEAYLRAPGAAPTN
jgi:type 1 glutamine amidotransferase